MSTYVLVHGAWHGAWCWEKIVPLLEQKGHTVHAIDLPGHGSDQTPVSQISLKSYTDKICSVIDEADEPVILVGHSMGGMVITQSAEYRPEQIKALVYVTAFLIRDGESMVDVIQTDAGALVASNMIVSSDGSYATVNEAKIKEIFYGCSEHADAERAKSLLNAQALEVLATKLSLTDERFGQVPRYYIECLRDQAITNWCQKNMYAATPCESVYTLDTDHSPFYSTPQELATILLEIEQINQVADDLVS